MFFAMSGRSLLFLTFGFLGTCAYSAPTKTVPSGYSFEYETMQDAVVVDVLVTRLPPSQSQYDRNQIVLEFAEAPEDVVGRQKEYLKIKFQRDSPKRLQVAHSATQEFRSHGFYPFEESEGARFSFTVKPRKIQSSSPGTRDEEYRLALSQVPRRGRVSLNFQQCEGCSAKIENFRQVPGSGKPRTPTKAYTPKYQSSRKASVESPAPCLIRTCWIHRPHARIEHGLVLEEARRSRLKRVKQIFSPKGEPLRLDTKTSESRSWLGR